MLNLPKISFGSGHRPLIGLDITTSSIKLIELTRELEAKWGVSAIPQVQQHVPEPPKEEPEAPVKTEFTVFLAEVPAASKMNIIKERFAAEVRETNQSKDYIIGLMALPEEADEFENAIRYNIEKASYSY